MILCVARCQKFVRTEDVPEADLALEGSFGDYTPGRWAWYFDAVVPLDEPVRVPPQTRRESRLSLWELPEEMANGPLAAAARKAARG